MSNLFASALAVTALWGIVPIMQKSVLVKYPIMVVYLMTGLLHAVSLPVLAFLYRKQIMVHMPTIPAKDWGTIVLGVVLPSVLASIIYMSTLKNNHSYLVVAMTSVYPLFTMLFAYVMLREKVTPTAALGVVCIVLGVTLLSIRGPATN